jgi:hypothetical protein
MKTHSLDSKWNWSIASAAAVILLAALSIGARQNNIYTAHEWGTFTSVQGGDGVLLDWRPLETSRLPGFVYDWKKPGLNRQGTSMLALGKGGLVTLQRMETPVIYFYANNEQIVDVSVHFPQGLITEWYPQAEQIGPSTVPIPAVIATADDYAHRAGANPAFTFGSLWRNGAVKESRARWAKVHILPQTQNASLSTLVPTDRSGTHYFAARATDANYLQIASLVATNPFPEQEKFIFYRGVGNFSTPLKASMDLGGAVTIANQGGEPLSHLFILASEKKAGGFIEVEHLSPGEQRTVDMKLKREPLMGVNLSHKLAGAIAKAAVKEGLFPREAAAMVDTWKDSWFEEDGFRVLYVLPREWTDRTLPLKLDPAPRSLVRVMVGRAEILAPVQEKRLADAILKASQGDQQARQEVLVELKRLGRFAEPALRLAMKDAKPPVTQTGWTLFQAAATTAIGNKPIDL